MQIIVSLLKIVKAFFTFNFYLRKPARCDITIFDRVNSDQIIKHIHDLKYEVIDARYETINIPVIINLLFSGKKINFRNYIIKYIELTQCKIVVTALDNNILFLNLKKYLHEVITITLQQAWRNPFYFSNILANEKNLKIDFALTFNKKFSDLFSKYIKAEYHEIGSFVNNNYIIKKNKKSSITLVSEVSIGSQSKIMNISGKTILTKNFYSTDKKLLKNISKYCLRNNLNLKVLGKLKDSHDSAWEKKFYDSILGLKNYEFLKNYEGRDTYNICDEAKVLIGTFSTLILENLGRKNRTAIFNNKITATENKDFNLFFPNNFSQRGKFWTDSIDVDQVSIILDFCYYGSDDEWEELFKTVVPYLMKYDKNNQIFKSIIKKYIKKNDK